MDVGAIGGAMCCSAANFGATSVGGAQMAGVTSATDSANGPGPQAAQSAMPGEITARLQALAELTDGFSSAEILMALMMMRGGGDKQSSGGGAALELLAGMAIAGQMQQMMHQASGSGQSTGMQGFESGAGSQMDLSV